MTGLGFLNSQAARASHAAIRERQRDKLRSTAKTEIRAFADLVDQRIEADRDALLAVLDGVIGLDLGDLARRLRGAIDQAVYRDDVREQQVLQCVDVILDARERVGRVTHGSACSSPDGINVSATAHRLCAGAK